MPLFALPLAPSSTTAHSALTKPLHFSTLPNRKRKRGHPSPPHSSGDEQSSDANDNLSFAAASTNPLSLTPAETVQYRLAGLDLNQKLPTLKDFPHRGILGNEVPLRRKDHKGRDGRKDKAGDVDKEKETEDNAEEKQKKGDRGPRLRIQHLGVLTAIVNRCLQQRDIARASRAWSMLVRAQVGGRAIDLKGTGYWAIGAELLVRGYDRDRRAGHDSDTDEESQEGGQNENKAGEERGWGTAQGWEKAKDYYERLILEHPYNRQFQGNFSALDLWPRMLVCEIFGIQDEQKKELRKIAALRDNEEGDVYGSEVSGGENLVDSESGDSIASEDRKSRIKRQKTEEKIWRAREEVRVTALVASENIATRMDDLMITPPYSDSLNLIEFRANLAQYIGDLSVPEMPNEEPDDSDEDHIDLEFRRSRRLGNEGKGKLRRLLFRQRLHEYNIGNRKHDEEFELAEKLFRRVSRGRGRVRGASDVSMKDNEDQEESYDAED